MSVGSPPPTVFRRDSLDGRRHIWPVLLESHVFHMISLSTNMATSFPCLTLFRVFPLPLGYGPKSPLGPLCPLEVSPCLPTPFSLPSPGASEHQMPADPSPLWLLTPALPSAVSSPRAPCTCSLPWLSPACPYLPRVPFPQHNHTCAPRMVGLLFLLYRTLPCSRHLHKLLIIIYRCSD